ncbi:Hypothetical predicted protein [Olea europaea subsp. europaea]|uniref:Uncharacterized protein n=1 Tax=Olea europaea subsp. europaea TaxID=158383 RepID=A0A8S0UDM7_OLEEU|nr:Hypothetical predicted protein [Olea europaea subsp. europaea]
MVIYRGSTAMSSTEDETVPRWTRERLGEEASLQRAPISQETWSAAPAVLYRKGSSRSRPRLAAKLTRKLAIVVVNIRVISRQNPAMQELLRHVQGQLANS